MTPRQIRRLRRKFEDQIRLERNGAPIPGEIAERMSQPRPAQQLYQVVVENRERAGRLLPVGPAVVKPVADTFAATINNLVSRGLEKTWANAQVIPCVPIRSSMQ